MGSTKPSLPVALTCQSFAYFMELALESTSARLCPIHLRNVRWLPWCTQWSPPCWTLSSTAWGTGTLKVLYGNYRGKQPNLITLSIISIVWLLSTIYIPECPTSWVMLFSWLYGFESNPLISEYWFLQLAFADLCEHFYSPTINITNKSVYLSGLHNF